MIPGAFLKGHQLHFSPVNIIFILLCYRFNFHELFFPFQVTGVIDGHKKSKKDCKWLFTSHGLINADEFISKVDPTEGDLLFKFEPFILHIQCSSLEKARSLVCELK